MGRNQAFYPERGQTACAAAHLWSRGGPLCPHSPVLISAEMEMPRGAREGWNLLLGVLFP